MAMAAPPTVTALQVEDYVFPPFVKAAPGSDKSFFLGGAGVRGLEIEGRFIKFTAIGVYLEETAIPALAVKWKGKTTAELVDSAEFFRDIITGPFEKFIQVTMILPLTGQQYSEKVTKTFVASWKSVGIYTDKEADAIEKFLKVFKDEMFPTGHSIMYTQSTCGSLTIAFSKHNSIPKVGNETIQNNNLSEAVLESIIGGVCPEVKQSLATRVSDLLNDKEMTVADAKVAGVAVRSTQM